jgi:hypothetical protein
LRDRHAHNLSCELRCRSGGHQMSSVWGVEKEMERTRMFRTPQAVQRIMRAMNFTQARQAAPRVSGIRPRV